MHQRYFINAYHLKLFNLLFTMQSLFKGRVYDKSRTTIYFQYNTSQHPTQRETVDVDCQSVHIRLSFSQLNMGKKNVPFSRYTAIIPADNIDL